MGDDKIVLYDIPSSGHCRSWSLNVWKTRLILNFKKIPYETKWVPLSHVGDTIRALGLEPNAPGTAMKSHTVPTILLADGHTHVMNSLLITPKLEELYPEPSLQLQGNVHIQSQEVVNQIIQPLIPYWLPKIANDVMCDEDKEWFFQIRAPEACIPLEQWEQTPVNVFWDAARPGLEMLVEMLTKTEGPFLLGNVPSYGDFVLVAAIKMFEVIGEEDLAKFLEFPAVRKLWGACGEWMERDD